MRRFSSVLVGVLCCLGALVGCSDSAAPNDAPGAADSSVAPAPASGLLTPTATASVPPAPAGPSVAVPAAGVQLTLPQGYAPMVPAVVITNPQTAPENFRRAAAAAGKSVPEYAQSFQGVELIGFGPVEQGFNDNFNLTFVADQPLPTTPELLAQLALVGVSPKGAGRSVTTPLGQALVFDYTKQASNFIIAGEMAYVANARGLLTFTVNTLRPETTTAITGALLAGVRNA